MKGDEIMDKILEIVEKWFVDNGYGDFFKFIKEIATFIATL